MQEFTLKRKEAKTLRLTIGEESFQIPLGGSLTPEKSVTLNTPEGTIAFFNEYIPEDIAKTLTVDEYNEITEVWKRATQKAAGKSVGE